MSYSNCRNKTTYIKHPSGINNKWTRHETWNCFETTRYMKQHAKSQFLRATIVTLFNFLLATSRLPPPSLNFTSVLTISNFCEVSSISRIFSLSTQYAVNDSSLFEQSKNILPEIHANTQCSALVNWQHCTYWSLEIFFTNLFKHLSVCHKYFQTLKCISQLFSLLLSVCNKYPQHLSVCQVEIVNTQCAVIDSYTRFG